MTIEFIESGYKSRKINIFIPWTVAEKINLQKN